MIEYLQNFTKNRGPKKKGAGRCGTKYSFGKEPNKYLAPHRPAPGHRIPSKLHKKSRTKTKKGAGHPARPPSQATQPGHPARPTSQARPASQATQPGQPPNPAKSPSQAEQSGLPGQASQPGQKSGGDQKRKNENQGFYVF